ncbi:MAG TPA: stage V sporulation protein E [Clostridia bacterium]|nr:stage V sporulation protein E [Clostridia bacterium]
MVMFLTVITLLSIGVVMVFSASQVTAFVRNGDCYYYLKRQLLWSLIALGVMVVVMKIDYWIIKKFSKLIFFGSFLLLIAVLIPGIGRESHGASRWIPLGSFSLQPSEIAKFALIIYVSLLLEKKQAQIGSFFKGLLPVLLIAGVVGGLILLQPDLGTAFTAMATVGVMLFAAGAKFGHLLGLAASALPLLYIAITSEDYRKRRFLAFLDPWSDPLDTGFHIIQSLYALGSGGLFGVGLGRSRQKLFYLPEQHTDSIFAIIGEELGFIGVTFVVLLFFLFAWRGYKIAITAPDFFSSMLAVGVTSLITFQAIINMGVVTASLPVTGIPLPLISYGGSSLLFTLAGVGILLNISRYTEQK